MTDDCCNVYSEEKIEKQECKCESAASFRKTQNCMFCGEKLIYTSQAKEMLCTYCEEIKATAVYCSEGHFVCEDCHGGGIDAFIKSYTMQSDLINPIQIAEDIMTNSKLPFLGGEHHYIVSAALLAALKNYGEVIIDNTKRTINDEDIQEGIRRMKQIPSCTCAYQGACGAGIGIGTVFSILYKATCAKDVERTLAMRATNTALSAISNTGGPACCKQSVRIAIEVGVELLKESFNIKLPINRVKNCRFTDRNVHGCKETKCLYFS